MSLSPPLAVLHGDDNAEMQAQPVRFAGLSWLKVLFAGLL
jgi:hypothetical protein